MPFRHLKPDQFTPELLDRMQEAFDRVSGRLKLSPDNPLRSKLATILIELATQGESEKPYDTRSYRARSRRGK
jgi:hypothetical protein